MQDSVGMFVEFNIEFSMESLPAAGTVFSKNLSINGDVWTIGCCPRGSCAGEEEYLSVDLLNRGAMREKAKIVFEAIVLGRSGWFFKTKREFDYPKKGEKVLLPQIFRTIDLAQRCVVNGYITVLCGLAVLQQSPIPVPPSTHARDLLPLEVRSPYGDPDVSFSIGDKLVPVNRKVLAARSPVFRAELTGSMAESTAPVVHPPREFDDATFLAVLWYVYKDRLPRENEVAGLIGEGLPMVELLAAADWFAMDRLKLVCARKLWEDVSIETVSKTFYYADRYNCRELRNACMHYMAEAENMRRVAVTQDYVWLAQNYPCLIEALRQRIMAEHM
ncbi:hypothetical protein PR202_ga20879 [Eleusine coracana subsp. coracana]|uniref:BTB domain-containing protein n=1 Tax=Eleusine coracana subsp. coracana TaxID=191504 RepID=A0AAV5CXS1_ELECO|nr:hypothetical protein QOZ80_8AG0629410 [Eleusine coracana subsp. coracana]GJN03434.1 hypothetical protein PR202_ga20879 [Eleusine coracana subsp. coracana]